MSLLQEIQKGFRFQICGLMSEPLVFTDESGAVTRFARVSGINRTFSLSVDSEEELAAFPAVNTPIRAAGTANRRNKTFYCSPKVTDLIFPGRPGWKDLTDDEVLSGAAFSGWGMLMNKRSGIYQGTPYRKILVGGWGDSFEFRDIPEDVFLTLPAEGRVPIFVTGHLDPVLSQMKERATDNRVVSSDMAYIVDTVKVGDPGAASKPSRPPEKSAA
jgi:hypothetical protein